MANPWRQGDLIAPIDAEALELIDAIDKYTARVVVISHSCDIASGADLEPEVEVIVGAAVSEADAKYRNGHSIRQLNLKRDSSAGIEWSLLRMGDRKLVDKPRLAGFQPWPDGAFSQDQRGVLRRWLAQRYSRSEFPNAFIDWLKASGVGDRFEKLAKKYSDSLIGIYFDLDDDTAYCLSG